MVGPDGQAASLRTEPLTSSCGQETCTAIIALGQLGVRQIRSACGHRVIVAAYVATNSRSAFSATAAAGATQIHEVPSVGGVRDRERRQSSSEQLKERGSVVLGVPQRDEPASAPRFDHAASRER